MSFNANKITHFHLWQVGAFSYDSYRLFGLDDTTCVPSDKNLRAFATWRKTVVVKEEDKKE